MKLVSGLALVLLVACNAPPPGTVSYDIQADTAPGGSNGNLLVHYSVTVMSLCDGKCTPAPLDDAVVVAGPLAGARLTLTSKGHGVYQGSDLGAAGSYRVTVTRGVSQRDYDIVMPRPFSAQVSPDTLNADQATRVTWDPSGESGVKTRVEAKRADAMMVALSDFAPDIGAVDVAGSQFGGAGSYALTVRRVRDWKSAEMGTMDAGHIEVRSKTQVTIH